MRYLNKHYCKWVGNREDNISEHILEYIAYCININRIKRLIYCISSKDNSITSDDLIMDIYIKFSYDLSKIHPDSIYYFLIDKIRSITSLKNNYDKVDDYGYFYENHCYDLVEKTTDTITVDSLISELSYSESQLIRMYYYDGMSMREIATELNSPHTTIAHKLKNIIEKLKTRV